MKIIDFLSNLTNKENELIFLCAKHMLNKNFNIEEDELSEDELKEFFINYNNYDKYLNDYANIIYKRYESSNNEIYETLCNFFNENSDNRYLFEYRLKRVSNQDPKLYLSIEDSDMRDAAIYRVENKIKTIEESKFYKENPSFAKDEIQRLKDTINLVKKAVGIV